MTLRQKQSKFVRMVALLIQFAYEQGYELTWGDAMAKTGHMPNSLHYVGLAVDFNLFKDGKYMKAKKGYRKQKPDSPRIGKWLKRYWKKRTCRKRT